MRRKLLTFFSAASLLLCAAACVMWVRSYHILDQVNFDPGQHRNAVESGHGIVLVRIATGDRPTPGRRLMLHCTNDARTTWLLLPANDHRLPGGFYWDSGRVHGSDDIDKHVLYAYRSLFLPHWALVTAMAALPLYSLVARLRRPTRAPGHCPSCGYDLRATPDRCPECGTAVSVRRSTTGDNPK